MPGVGPATGAMPITSAGSGAGTGGAGSSRGLSAGLGVTWMRDGAAGLPPPGSGAGFRGGGGGGGGVGRNSSTLMGGAGGSMGASAWVRAITANTSRCAAETPTITPAVRSRFFVR